MLEASLAEPINRCGSAKPGVLYHVSPLNSRAPVVNKSAIFVNRDS